MQAKLISRLTRFYLCFISKHGSSKLGIIKPFNPPFIYHTLSITHILSVNLHIYSTSALHYMFYLVISLQNLKRMLGTIKGIYFLSRKKKTFHKKLELQVTRWLVCSECPGNWSTWRVVIAERVIASLSRTLLGGDRGAWSKWKVFIFFSASFGLKQSEMYPSKSGEYMVTDSTSDKEEHHSTLSACGRHQS